nr:MAG TPA_asm: hypothetical protein [Caudoviricetes sp.]
MQVRTRRTTLTKIIKMCRDYPDCEETLTKPRARR